MRSILLLSLSSLALAVPFLVPTAAEACERGGGQVEFQPVISQSEILLQSIQRHEEAAIQQDATARAARQEARQQRALAAALRERARIFSDLDTRTLLNQAAVADRQAKRADARASTASAQASAFRAKANELRALAQELLVGPRRTVI